MADDLSNRGQVDRILINLNDHHEVHFWTTELGVTAAQLRELIKKHGAMAIEIREALDKM